MCMLFRTSLLVLFVLSTTSSAAEPIGPSKTDWDKAVNGAINYLKTSQNPDGSWGAPPRNRGVTGVVVTGLLRSNKVGPEEQPAAKGLEFIESLVNPEAGHIAGKDAIAQLQNYVTSVNVMALQTANQPEKYKSIVSDAASFLKKLQWDEGEGKTPNDDFYGGGGYDSKSRPDLSNTQFMLDALKEAGVPNDDPAFRKALVFVSRCQNLKSEFNDKPWAGEINDGSFIYSAAAGGQTKVEDADGALIGYGSMTYAGIKSMIYCGVSKDDPRYRKAMEWVKKNYTVKLNPGMEAGNRERGLYYYYHTMAKTLAVMDVDYIETPDGVKHDWRKDLTQELLSRQSDDGSWTNQNDRWMEGEPPLVTGYALLALSYCKPRE